MNNVADIGSGKRYQTRGVLGGAYKGKRASLKAALTHLSDETIGGGEDALCGKVKPGNLADEYAHSDEFLASRPTCPACAKLWDKLQG